MTLQIQRKPGSDLTVKKQNDRLRFTGYLVRFTSENDKDLDGNWFSKRTNFNLQGHPLKGRPILFHHAMDMKMGAIPIGIIDFVKEDEVGIWIEGWSNTRAEYEAMLNEMQERKAADFEGNSVPALAKSIEDAVHSIVTSVKSGWSGGALPQSVLVDEDTGHIDQWNYIEASITPIAAEPDGTELLIKAIEPLANGLRDAPPHKDGIEETTGNRTIEPIRSFTLGVKTVEQLLEAIREVLQQFLGEEETPPEDMAAMETAAADAVAAAMDDEEEDVKAALTDDGQLTDKMLGVVTKSLVEYVAKVRAEEAVKLAKAEAQKQTRIEKSLRKAMQDQPSVPLSQTHGGFSESDEELNRKGRNIQVSESLQYAHLTPSQMALGIKLIRAKSHEFDRQYLPLKRMVDSGIISNEYVKTMQMKIGSAVKQWDENVNHSNALASGEWSAVKATMPYKADEMYATDISGQGSEWVEVFYDTQVWRDVRENTELFDRMQSKGMRVKDIPTGVKGMNVKLADNTGTVYTLQEGGSADASNRQEVVVNYSNFDMNELEVNLASHIIAQGITYQLEERSLVDAVAEIEYDMMTRLTESLENTMINGDDRTADSVNINKIDGTPAGGLSSPDYLAWDGIRNLVLQDGTSGTHYIDNGGTALVATDYERVRALFPLEFRRRKNEMLFIIDEEVETQTRRLAEHFTVGVAGDRATFFTGDLNVLVGYDVYASSFLNLANGNGKISVTAGNNTQAQIYGLYCPYWQYGRQLQITLEEERSPLAQARVMVARVNHLFVDRSAFAAVGMFDIEPV